MRNFSQGVQMKLLPLTVSKFCLHFFFVIFDVNQILPFRFFIAPQTFAILFQAFRPVLSKQNRDLFQIFGPNKLKWKSYLDSKIDPEKLKALDID